jgi:hypothetical protein
VSSNIIFARSGTIPACMFSRVAYSRPPSDRFNSLPSRPLRSPVLYVVWECSSHVSFGLRPCVFLPLTPSSIGAILTANARNKGMFLGGRYLTGKLLLCYREPHLTKRLRSWVVLRGCLCKVVSGRDFSTTISWRISRLLKFFVSNNLNVARKSSNRIIATMSAR